MKVQGDGGMSRVMGMRLFCGVIVDRRKFIFAPVLSIQTDVCMTVVKNTNIIRNLYVSLDERET